MIPTPRRLRANRLASAAFAAAAATTGAATGWILLTAPAARGAAAAAALLLAAGLYRLGTRAMRRRSAVLARPFPPDWSNILHDRVAFYACLDETEKRRFEQLAAIFLAEVPLRAVRCELDDTTRLLVAASAVIPVFGLPGWEYRTLREILVYPDTFDARFGYDDWDDDEDDDPEDPTTSGLVGDTGSAFKGTMVLSKEDLLYGFERHGDKYNVGIHEFAHLVDQADGRIDGAPGALSRKDYRDWLDEVRRQLAAGRSRDIPEYAYTNESEFFAVASEYFFEAPDRLATNHPRLYELLQTLYNQDLRARLAGLRRARLATDRPRRAARHRRRGQQRRDP